MTIINRALLKAFERQNDSVVASDLELHPSAVVRGWARKLREPVRGVPKDKLPEMREERKREAEAAKQAPVPASTIENSGQPVVSLHRPDGTTLRIDEAHPRSAANPPMPPAKPKSAPSAVTTEPAAMPALTAAALVPNWAWPAIVDRLLACPAADALRELADRVLELAVNRDLRCVAFSGPARRTGRTSLICTLARVLTEEKLARVAVLDAHFDNPGLAQMLSFRAGKGFGEAVCDESLDAADAIAALSEKLVIAPLIERIPDEAIDREGIAALQNLLRTLRHDHEVVLVDAGPWDQTEPPAVLECRTIDAFIGVTRSRSPSPVQIDELDLEQLGIEWLGEVETFVPPSHA